MELDRVITPDCSYLAESDHYDPQVFLQQLEKERRRFGNSKVIISAETLSGRGDGNPMWDELRIAERLYQTFEGRASVIAVVRNPIDYILSLYTFRVVTRGMEHRSLTGYLEDKFDKSLNRKMDYHRLLSRYIELFGRDNVLVLAYEQLQFDYPGFLSSFCNFMGAPVPDVPPDKVNPGYRNVHVVAINRRLNTPVSLTLDWLMQKSLISRERYVSLATTWYGLKRRALLPVLTSMFSEKCDLSIPDEWETRMRRTFKTKSRKLQQLINQDLGVLGWPV